MESLFRYIAPPSPCGYLPDQRWRLEFEHVAAVTPAEYMERMLQGWRRFGHVLFRPRCRRCTACQSIRVDAARFRPDRSQRRVRKANECTLDLRITSPSVTRTKLALYDLYHAHQAETKGWPAHPAKDAYEYASSFVLNPFETEEWCYYLGPRLVAVGYVDALPGGLSAIYFYYDPAERQRSLGTWNILCVIEETRRRGLPYTYLGYFVDGCRSMTYKARFRPNQLLNGEARWEEFQT
jgi:arginine-tRNA-protein transferase